ARFRLPRVLPDRSMPASQNRENCHSAGSIPYRPLGGRAALNNYRGREYRLPRHQPIGRSWQLPLQMPLILGPRSRPACALGPQDVAMDRCFEFDSLTLCPDAPIFDVMRKALLTAVEIDSADPLTLF